MSQIYANDLILGDWVMNEFGEIQQVRQLKDGFAMLDYNVWYEEEDLKGVPLTAEILEKNGFVKSRNAYKYERYAGDGYQTITLTNRLDGLWDVKVVDYDKFNDSESTCEKANKFLKVHELQHIIKDCDIEKEIVL